MRTNLFRTAAACVTVFLCAGEMSGQEHSPEKKQAHHGGFGHFNFSGQVINLRPLNDALTLSGYNTFNSNQASWGGGGCFVISNFIIGGEGAGLFNSTVSNSVNSIQLSGGYGAFHLGYLLHRSKRSLFYSALGAGLGGYSLMVNQKNNPATFGEQIGSPKGSVTLNAGGALFNAQVAYQYFFCGKETSGFFAGIKAGYRISTSHWKINAGEASLDSAPTMNMNGAYLTLILGGGHVGKSN